MSDRRLPPPPLIALGIVLVAAVAVAILVRPSPDDIERTFDGGGALGPLAYALAYALLTVALIPGAALTLAAGALFGVVGGTAVSVVGATLGASAAFLISRHSTRGSVERTKGRRLAALERRLEGRGFFALLALRLIPVMPFNALNYAAGATSIETRDYLLATAVGIIPGAFAYAALGAGVDDPISPTFIAAAALVVLLAVTARIASRRSDPDLLEDRPESDERSAALRRLGWAGAFFATVVGLFAVALGLGLFH